MFLRFSLGLFLLSCVSHADNKIECSNGKGLKIRFQETPEKFLFDLQEPATVESLVSKFNRVVDGSLFALSAAIPVGGDPRYSGGPSCRMVTKGLLLFNCPYGRVDPKVVVTSVPEKSSEETSLYLYSFFVSNSLNHVERLDKNGDRETIDMISFAVRPSGGGLYPRDPFVYEFALSDCKS